MSAEFVLRDMLPSDGPALQQLMEDDPAPSGMSMTTCFHADPYQAWRALKPNMTGVVAELPGAEGIVGAATVAFDAIQFEDRVIPAAFLENLKVHHAHRGRGLGTQLAQWRVDRARERFGAEGAILTTTSSDNSASLATMKKWAGQLVETVRVVPRARRATPPRRMSGVSALPAEPGDFEEIALKSNRFYAAYNLYPPLSAESLAGTLGEIYHYRTAIDAGGNVIAGAMLSERARLMTDEVCNVPPPMRLANKVLRIMPGDYVIRLMEVAYLWFDTLAAGRFLWESIRWEFRDRASSFSAPFDERSPLKDVLQAKPWSYPKLRLVMAVSGPMPLDTARLVSGSLRG